MALDVHRLANGRPAELLLSINEAQYQQLLPAFQDFELKTGLKVDPYSDLRLGDVGPLIDSLERSTLGGSLSAVALLKSVLVRARNEDWSVIFVGD